MLKDRVTAITDFLDAVERVASGGTVLDRDVVAQLLVRQRRDDPLRKLTAREMEVLAFLVRNIFAKLMLPPDDEQHRRGSCSADLSAELTLSVRTGPSPGYGLPVNDRPGRATVVSIVHPPADLAAFDSWAMSLIETAEASSGFVAASVSVRDSADLEPAVAATFETVEAAEDWLDGAARTGVVRSGQALGIWAALPDVLLAPDVPLPSGLGAVDHSVAAGSEQQFVTAQRALTAAAARAAGYQGTTLFPPGGRGDWLSVLRFRTDRQLADWMTSAERNAALPGLRSALAREFSVASQTTAFGTTVRVEDGRTRMTPGWKSAMLVLLVLYPTVMLLSRFFGPVLDGWGAAPWLALWISQVVSIALLQWWLMPLASRLFQRWLDPIDGAAAAVSVRGALVVAALYAVTLALFASVTWLQYWAHPNG